MDNKIDLITKIFIIVILLICVYMFMPKYIGNISGDSLDDVIEKGLFADTNAVSEVLYIEKLKEDVIVYYSLSNAIGVGNAINYRGKWYVKDLLPLTVFNQTDFNFACTGGWVETLSGEKHCIIIGRIFTPNITKIEILDGKIPAYIKNNNTNKFFFARGNDEKMLHNVKAYDINNLEINDIPSNLENV